MHTPAALTAIGKRPASALSVLGLGALLGAAVIAALLLSDGNLAAGLSPLIVLAAAWALWAAQTLGAVEPAWRYALRRLALDGVDVRTWSPRADRGSRSLWDW